MAPQKGGGLTIFAFWISVWAGIVALVAGLAATSRSYPLPSAERLFLSITVLFAVAQIGAVVLAVISTLLKRPRRLDLLLHVLIAVFALTVVFLFVLRRVGMI